MIYGPHGPYIPPSYAVCTFPECGCPVICNTAIPRRAVNSSRWAIYGALAFLAVVAVVIAARAV